jgi:hypothetical protein
MKKIMSAILGLVLVTGVALAVEALTLKANMKQTGLLLKQITATVNDTTKNQANADAAAQMATYFTSAREQTPGVGSLQEYQALMDQGIDLFKQLQTAFKNNDTATAQAVLQKISVLKKEGHDKFN